MFIEELAGPKVVFIDDLKKDVEPIIDVLNDRNLSNFFIDASPEMQKPESPIQSVELVFLDLYFTNTMNGFDAEVCAQIIQKIVPPSKQYYLVVFSRDSDKSQEVLDVLEKIDLSPVKTLVRLKSKYDLNKVDEINRLLDEISEEFDRVKRVEEYYGEIISIEDDIVIIDCLVDADNKVFQVRRFEFFPLSNLGIEEGSYIQIRTITKLGSIVFEFSTTSNDLTNLFTKDLYFNDLKMDLI